MLGVILLDLFVVLFGGVMVLLFIFVCDIFYIGLEGLGLLRLVLVLGVVGVGFWLVC